jgi:anti-sigma-K factor RskA
MRRASRKMSVKKLNNSNNSSWTENRKRRSAISAMAIVSTLAIILSSPATIQPAFAHAETILPVSVDDQQGRGIIVVVGHSDEPAYGAKLASIMAYMDLK